MTCSLHINMAFGFIVVQYEYFCKYISIITFYSRLSLSSQNNGLEMTGEKTVREVLTALSPIKTQLIVWVRVVFLPSVWTCVMVEEVIGPMIVPEGDGSVFNHGQTRNAIAWNSTPWPVSISVFRCKVSLAVTKPLSIPTKYPSSQPIQPLKLRTFDRQQLILANISWQSIWLFTGRCGY